MATKPKTTAVAVKAATNIVSIKDALKAQVAALADRTAPASGNAIRITQDKFFVLPDGTKTPGPLELVVVDFTGKNAYYPAKFDPKKIVPPDCFAISTNVKAMVPSKNSPAPQNSSCTGCMHAAFGPNSEPPECKIGRALAVLPPDADHDTPLWTLGVSPTATKGFDSFVAGVARVFDTPPVGVVVTVGFDPNRTYASLVFSDPQANENLAVHFARQPEATQMLTVEPDVSGWVAPVKNAKVARR